ncbi:DNA/RNA non-specific endonuclease [Aetokthonos hydrillicola Thurmond2011]|jgi:endonuclease G|uniref:DNA/RNA non-specific endonuclease n=1 Tax=Aetokthonos hydrillicola Thurmond2011 TaxID=2712845 RepID=A0AAP5IEJ2_9CYAN|nr:DNA/RNA non-specific endonuclease [Aetokthonos hydrillicola]MBO3461220.1 DNA/RNA non-specific endonuclease [Aetokthonos hydrillicola CCALA 1050]MBW4591051.1 DNA/RNA non-specific endonuclease [Aetokthonos hydrillicola CCALA 1050]MDR9900221.1 DNA/RNA non-specific endonuclease [Aetokthonos hydrillicola Thurmond2011]
MNWISRQIRDFAPLTVVVVVGIFTYKWWLPYLDSTASHSTVDRPEITSETTSYKSVHLSLGNPSGATASVSNPDNYLMIKPQYALSYNRSKGTANWVSWELNSSWLGGVDRQNNFRPDDTLPAGWERVMPSVYSRSGYDKGHIVPSGDRTSSAQDNSQTFLMTNMMPQTPDNNRHTWEGLEVYCRQLARQGKELYIIAGTYGSQGTLKGQVTIPQSTWKVVVVLDYPGAAVTANTRVIAVNVPNQQGINYDWRAYRVSVKELEKLTGYHFLDKVPGASDVVDTQ